MIYGQRATRIIIATLFFSKLNEMEKNRLEKNRANQIEK